MSKTSKRAILLQKQFLKQQKIDELNKYKVSIRESLMHQSWCFKNGIIIYFQPIDWREGKIIVNYFGDITESNEIYKHRDLKDKDIKYWDVIWKLYTKFYIEHEQESKKTSN